MLPRGGRGMKKLMVIIIVLVFSPGIAFCDDAIYDNHGRYKGYSHLNKNSSTNYYDSHGRYKGYAAPSRSKILNMYDSHGRYKGYAQERNNGGYNYYNERGQFIGSGR